MEPRRSPTAGRYLWRAENSPRFRRHRAARCAVYLPICDRVQWPHVPRVSETFGPALSTTKDLPRDRQRPVPLARRARASLARGQPPPHRASPSAALLAPIQSDGRCLEGHSKSGHSQSFLRLGSRTRRRPHHRIRNLPRLPPPARPSGRSLPVIPWLREAVLERFPARRPSPYGGERLFREEGEPVERAHVRR